MRIYSNRTLSLLELIQFSTLIFSKNNTIRITQSSGEAEVLKEQTKLENILLTLERSITKEKGEVRKVGEGGANRMKVIEKVCLVCDCELKKEEKEYILPCQCDICSDCCLEYLKSMVDSLSFQLDKEFKCANHKCSKQNSIATYRSHKIGENTYQLPKLIQLDDKLCLRALQNDFTMRSCPQPKCNYFGFLPEFGAQAKENPTRQFEMKKGNTPCSDPFKCDNCGTEWMDPSMQRKQQNVLMTFVNVVKQKNEIFSEMRKKFAAKKCPRCKVPISKNGGCQHMTCCKCDFDFCWYCLSSHSQHSRTKCLSLICLANTIYILPFIFLFFFLGLHHSFWEGLVKLFYLLGNFIAQNLFLFLLFLFGSFLIETHKLQHRLERYGFDGATLHSKKQNFNLALFTGGLSILYLLFLLFGLDFSLKQILSFMVLEGVLAFILNCIYNSACFFWRYWIQYVF